MSVEFSVYVATGNNAVLRNPQPNPPSQVQSRRPGPEHWPTSVSPLASRRVAPPRSHRYSKRSGLLCRPSSSSSICPPVSPDRWGDALNGRSKLTIKEAVSGDVLRPNHVFIANGGCHLELRKHGKFVKTLLRDGEPVSGHKPSADVMMKSAAEIYGANCMGIIMTGNGARRLHRLRPHTSKGRIRSRPGRGHVGCLRYEQGRFCRRQRRSPIQPQRGGHDHHSTDCTTLVPITPARQSLIAPCQQPALGQQDSWGSTKRRETCFDLPTSVDNRQSPRSPGGTALVTLLAECYSIRRGLHLIVTG